MAVCLAGAEFRSIERTHLLEASAEVGAQQILDPLALHLIKAPLQELTLAQLRNPRFLSQAQQSSPLLEQCESSPPDSAHKAKGAHVASQCDGALLQLESLVIVQ